jgi:glycosyltransferase involved in cell wall biosynthesis
MGFAKPHSKPSSMKQKKILYLRTDIGDTPLTAGGSVAHTLGVIEGFLSLGYSVICASSVMHTLLQKLPLQALYTLANPRLLYFLRWKLNCLLSSLFFTVQTLRYLRHTNIDFIYQRYSLLNCTGVLLSKIKKVNLILEYNGSEVWVDTFWTKKKWPSLRFLISVFERINLKYAHLIVVVSQPLCDELVARGFAQEKILVNPNGVNTEFFDPAKLLDERSTLRKELHIEYQFVFGFIGTFSAWHGIEILEAMIPEILAQKNNVHFLLIGNGPLFESFYKKIEPYIISGNVTCTGLIPQHQARVYLAACDTFLCPTQPNPDGTPFFGSPTKIFEYLSMAKPIIASDLEQVGDLISPAFKVHSLKENFLVTDQVGFALPAQNSQAFIKAACRLVDMQENERLKMGTCAREKAIKKFQWKNHVSNIITSFHT